MQIRFGDHSSFHRATLAMVVLAGAMGALAAALGAATGYAVADVWPTLPLAAGAIAIASGVAWAYGKPTVRLVAGGAAVGLVLMADSSWATTLPSGVALVSAACALALGLAPGGPTGKRGLLALAFTTVIVLVAMWCCLRVVNAQQTATLPQWLVATFGGTAMAIVGVISLLPRHIQIARDPVRTAIRSLPRSLDPEVHALCQRAIAIWTQADNQIGDPAEKRLICDGVVQTLGVAARSSTIQVSDGSELVARASELDARIANTKDRDAKEQYQLAREALEDQRRYREHISAQRERLVARMHNHVNALEKFQLAARGLRSPHDSSALEGSTPLAELSLDLATSGEALAELDETTASPGSPASLAPSNA